MRRLLVRYGVGMASAVLVAFLVPLALLARSQAYDRALDAAREDTQRIVALAGGATLDRPRLEAEVLAVDEGPRTTTVFLPDGSEIPEPAPRSAAVELALLGRAVTARTDGGVEMLVPVATADGLAAVRTFVPDAELTAGVGRTWTLLGAAGLLLLAATAFAGDRIARRLARSTQDLAVVAERLGSGDLAARVTPSGPPEVVSVGRVLNGLGARVSALLAAERELVADLSHRLRTPITALRLDVDMLDDPAERARMAAHVDELVKAVDAVVWAARHPTAGAPAARCDAVAVVGDRGRFWGVLAADRGRPLRIDVAPVPLAVPVSAADLGAAVDVLVDNVFSHTPDGTGFALVVRAVPGAVEVAVEDDGPGLPAAPVVARGHSGAGSTGLGLDVARRTAEDVGGRLDVGRGASGGARVALVLPAA